MYVEGVGLYVIIYKGDAFVNVTVIGLTEKGKPRGLVKPLRDTQASCACFYSCHMESANTKLSQKCATVMARSNLCKKTNKQFMGDPEPMQLEWAHQGTL